VTDNAYQTTGALAGKRVLITGAAAGFGLATASLFAKQGAHVVGMDLRWDEQIAGVTCIQGDVTSGSDVAAAVGIAAGDEGLDVVVANAGTIVIDDIRTADPQDWARVFNVNVLGVMRCFQAGALNMIETGRKGKLLTTGSISAMRPYAEGTSYCISKAAVHALVKSSALAFADAGITVNAVAPGPADTELYRQAIAQLAETEYTGGNSPEDHAVESASHIPLGRLATVEDIAQLFLFLASDHSGYINGVTVACDGGYLLTSPPPPSTW